ncbi:MAG TPA: hypothetical protein VNJ03_02965, partial [Vicinamibacterales bacterium]|nr:hypothetical protein [Vicinamibacterales bacterium]
MRSAVFIAVALCAGALAAHPTAQPVSAEPSWKTFLLAASSDERTARTALEEIGTRWRPGYAAMLVDVAR